MYSPRIKVYDFGQLTGVNSGSVIQTAHNIEGELIKLVVSGDRTAAAGSIFLQTNNLRLITLGSVINTNTATDVYLSVVKQGTGGAAGAYPVVNEKLQLSGAGVGTGSLFNIQLYYR